MKHWIIMVILAAGLAQASMIEVDILGLVNESFTTSLQPVITFTANSTSNATFNCSLLVDGGLVANNASYVNKTPTNITPGSSLAEASHSLLVNCADNESNMSSAIYMLYVDNTAPTVTPVLPADASTVNGQDSVLFNFTASDGVDTNLTYTLYINDTANETGWIVPGAYESFTVVGFTHGQEYNYTVEAVDGSGFKTNSTLYTFTFNDNVAPTTAPAFTSVNDTDSDGNVELVWAADANAATYRIYRNSVAVENVTGATLLGAVAATSFEVNTTVHVTMYHYALVSADAAANYNVSVLSVSKNGTADDTIEPKLPASISTSTKTDGSVLVSWDAVTADIDGNADTQGIRYILYRTTNLATLNTSLTTEMVKNTTSTTYTDTGITTGTTYYYVVTTADDAANRNASNSTRDSIAPSSCTTEYDWSAYDDCDDGEQSRTGTRTCYGGGDTESTGTRDCTSGGGSSGGGSRGTPAKNPKESWTWTHVTPGAASIMKVYDADMGLKTIEITVNNPAKNVKITVEKLAGKPAEVTKELTGKVYRYLEVKTANFEDDPKAKLKFAVQKTWMNANGIKNGQIVLMRYHDNWEELSTKQTGETSTEVVYEADTPGFSYFAISTKDVEEEPVTAQPATQEPAQEQTKEQIQEPVQERDQDQSQDQSQDQQPAVQPPEPEKKGGWGWLLLIVALGAIGGIAYVTFRKK